MDFCAFGFDTLVSVLEVASPLPVGDEAFQERLVRLGFRRESFRFRDVRMGGFVEGVRFVYQDEDRIFRITIRNPRHIKVEFSAARLRSGAVHNLNLVTAEEAYELIVQLARRILGFVPEAGSLKLLKFLRADCALDLYAGSHARSLISSLGNIQQLKGSRKLKRTIYQGEGIHNLGSTQSLVAYRKGVQLRNKLRGKDRKKHTALVRELIEKGLVRIEYRYHPKSGAPASYLNDAAEMFADKLESGLAKGKIRVAGSLKALVDFVDGLEELSSNKQDTLLADTVRESVYDSEYTVSRHSPRTSCRRVSLRRLVFVSLNNGEEDDEIDLNPIIEFLKAA